MSFSRRRLDGSDVDSSNIFFLVPAPWQRGRGIRGCLSSVVPSMHQIWCPLLGRWWLPYATLSIYVGRRWSKNWVGGSWMAVLMLCLKFVDDKQPFRDARNRGRPISTCHSDIGSACGGPLDRLTKPKWAMVFSQLRRCHVASTVIAMTRMNFLVFSIFWKNFLQIFLEAYLPWSFLGDSTCVHCIMTCDEWIDLVLNILPEKYICVNRK